MMEIIATFWESELSGLPWAAIGWLLLLIVLLTVVRWRDRRMLRMLQESARYRERLTTAIEQVDETIMMTDCDGNIEYVNPAFERITGYTRDEVIGKSPRMLKSGQHPDSYYRLMWQTINRGDVWKGRFVNKRKDGSLYTEEATISAVHNSRGKIVNFVAAKRDATHEIELESQQQQAQRMESVGRLAGGVAHDFNNMLQAILGHAEIAQTLIAPDHPACEDLNAIIHSARRSADLTRKLLAFARKQSIQPRLINLNATISDILNLLNQSVGEDVELAWQPGDGLGYVVMDPIQIEQVLVNLCVNARDAIEKDGHGRIQIATRNARLGGDNREYVALSVRDNGCGMDNQTLEHVFEPFFTTKRIGQGAGLGLATAYGIIRQNDGIIDVKSEPGQWSLFTVYLPRRDAPPVADATVAALTPVEAHTPSVAPTSKKPPTILMVEDEPSAMYVTKSMLERAGYHVLAADLPNEALRLAAESDRRIDLLLTDVIMPEMNGADLALRLQSECPQMQCLFMSGYAADFLGRADHVREGLHFIQKPFSAAMLDAKIKGILSRDLRV